MRLQVQYGTAVSRPFVGYTMWLSANNTYRWANKHGAKWPCSTLANKRVCVCVDSNGLCDLTINGKEGDCDTNELTAIVSDFLPGYLRHMWPTWETK